MHAACFFLQLRYYLYVCQLASAVFCEMTCWRVMAKPRRHLHFQNNCMSVNRFLCLCCIQQGMHSELTRTCCGFGMVTVLMSCKEGQSISPDFAALEVRPDCVACWNL